MKRRRSIWARVCESCPSYDQSVLHALQEIADAATNSRWQQTELTNAQIPTDAAYDTLNMAKMRSEGGLSNYIEVLSAEDTWLTSHVIYLGEPLLGRGEVEKNHIRVVTRWQKGTRMVIEPITTQFLTEDIASVLTAGALAAPKRFPTTSCKPSRSSFEMDFAAVPHFTTLR